jgi:probable selenium-dependent hydroxylase accessory protein YqeC
MALRDSLDIPRGLTCFTGSGGKTTTIETLAKELAEKDGATVIITTTTHMAIPRTFPLATDPAALSALLAEHRAVYAGAVVSDRKIGQLCDLADLLGLADYVLCEADGSARLPLKTHNATEPVVPAWCERTICLVGASGVGRPVGEAMHRAALRFGDLAQSATPALVAGVLCEEAAGQDVFINQADEHPQAADALAQALLGRGFAGRVWTGSARAGVAVPARANG